MERLISAHGLQTTIEADANLTMNQIMLILTGCFSVLGVLAFAFWHARRSLPTLEPLFYRTAGIAGVLVPLVNEQRLKYRKTTGNQNPYICVVGADGEYCTKDKWADAMAEWMRDGVTRIQYLLIGPTKSALDGLSKLRSQFPNQLEVLVVDKWEDLTDAHARELAGKYRTFHYVLFEAPKMMWVEGYHFHKTEASDCQFVPPQYVSRDSRFDTFKVDFDYIKQRATPLAA